MASDDAGKAPTEERLKLPSPEGVAQESTELKVGTTISLDALGPLVVNNDGTLSRISNWNIMTEPERKTTLRVLGKRNKLRLENEAQKLANAEASAKPSSNQ